MSDQDDYSDYDLGSLILFVFPMITIILANLGYLYFGDGGFWIGFFVCPIFIILYVGWVICIESNRQ
jgi:hypothetical protein